MAQSKTSYQAFQTDWAKTTSWAHGQKIAPSAYLPVYQMDAKRLLQYGTPMSQAERTRAVLASAGMSAVTQLPGDNPNPTNILHNAKNNLQQIFTGLEPVGLVKNLFDTVTNTIDHPSNLWTPAVDLTKLNVGIVTGNHAATQNAMHDFTNTVLAQHSIWSLVPGAVDAAHAYQGKEGFKYLADNPISSLLDVVPLGRIPLKVVAKTDFGARVAAQIGVHPEELGRMFPNQVAWKLLKSRPSNVTGVRRLPDGKVEARKLSRGERIDTFRNAHGAGLQQGELSKVIMQSSEDATAKVKELAHPALEAIGKLPKESLDKVTNAVYNDHRSDEEVLHDSQFNNQERDALEKVFDWGKWNYQLKLQAGGIVEITTPFGREPYIVKPGSSGAKVLNARTTANAAEETLQQASRKFDLLAIHTQDIDSMLNSHIEQIVALKSNIYESIKASIPELPDNRVTDTLRHALPEGHKWDRQVLKSDNLESYFGLEERTEPVVTRGAKEAAPFSGMFSSWSEPEREAWYSARDALLKTKYSTAKDIPRSEIKKQATDRLKLMGAARDKKIHSPVPPSAARTLKELVGPGGMVEQMGKAYEAQDWVGLRKLSEVADRKLNAKVFQSPHQAPPLQQLRQMVTGLKQFSRHRAKVMDQLNRMWYGTDRRGNKVATGKQGVKQSLEHLTKQAAKAHNEFLQAAIHNPPDVWRTAMLEEYTKQVMASEEGAKAVDKAYAHLSKEGWTDEELNKLREDPRAIMEMVALSSKASFENAMLPNLDYGESRAIQKSAFEEIAKLRAAGERPRYVPTVSPFDIRAGEGDRPFNVFLGLDHVPSVASAKEKVWDHTSSVYNLQAALLKETHQTIAHDATIELLDKHLTPHLYDRAELEPILRAHAKPYLDQLTGPNREANVTAFYEQQLSDFNLAAFDPKGLFGVTLPRFNGKTMYMDKDLINGLTQTIQKYQVPSSVALDKITNVFRTSILGYSPRFTAHIFFGGGFLLALRSSPDFARYIPDAWRMVKTGKLPEHVAAKLNVKVEDAHGVMQKSSTQEGIEEVKWQHATAMYHAAAGHSAGQFAIEENVAREMARTGADKATTLLKVIPNMNYRFTRWTTNMQRSISFLDGVHRANKQSHFYMDEVVDGKVTRVKKEMTPDEALHQGMQHVEKVMGDLRAMTPIERNFLIRAMPFWGWTKHILKYVMSYPMDHPYRAMFLSELAMQNSEQVASGLPLRIQLMFFMGKPDATGNVTALDVRALNPLRDTENYASLSGWLSALNPAFTAPVSMVDPNFTFGGNVMYPNITYNALYGTKQANASGSAWNAAEAIVPEITGVDAALNLSGQFAYLRQNGNSDRFIKKLAESVNFPWIPQTMNLRQTSATDEIDRYNQAKTAAHNAWTSGDFSQLAGYGNVPDPRNSQYDVAPAYLEALYKQTYQQTGLPPAAITKSLPSPRY